MDNYSLEDLIRNNNINAAIKKIENIGREKRKDFVPFLLEVLKKTDDNLLRNAVALALSDMRSQEAVEPLIELIQHPKTLGSKGTLLYALESLDCSQHIEVLVELLTGYGLEVSMHSIQILEKSLDELSVNEKIKIALKIKNKYEYLQNQVEILEEALELFE